MWPKFRKEKRRKFKDKSSCNFVLMCQGSVFVEIHLENCRMKIKPIETWFTNVQRKYERIWIIAKDTIKNPDIKSPTSSTKTTTTINRQTKKQQTEELTFEHSLNHFTIEPKLVTGERFKKHYRAEENNRARICLLKHNIYI